MASPIPASPENPKPDRWGRYRFPHPGNPAGKAPLESWQRTTTLIKMPSDTYHLDAWKQRSVAKGLGLRPDLVASAAMLDVKADSSKLNDIVGQALDASGAGNKANLGTALHSMTEAYDRTGDITTVPEAYRHRVLQYSAALEAHKLTIDGNLIERSTASVQYKAAGTFDRILGRSDGSPVMADLKTGSSLDFGQKEIAAQLAVYVDGVNSTGIWNGKKWVPLQQPVRTDFGYVIHLPSDGDGCQIYEVDLAKGRAWVELCCAVREARQDKSSPFELLSGDPLVDPYAVGDAAVDPWQEKLAACTTRVELVAVADNARAAGEWTDHLANWARSYAKALELMS